MKIQEETLNISRLTYESGELVLEGLLLRPDGKGEFPGVVFIHGHKSNGWDSLWVGYRLAKEGFATFLPSQMGYPFSEGKPDFCGIKTVQGVLDGIKIFLEKDFVNSEKIGIWGVSRGATIAASAATREPALFEAAVFQSGVYEMKSHYETTQIQGIRDVIFEEADGSEKSFRERSPIYDMESLSCPVLILHGEVDERISVEQARMIDKKLTELGKEHQTVILPGEGHYIMKQTRISHTFPFISKHLKD